MLRVHVGGAVDGLQNQLDLLSLLHEHVEIITKQLHAQVGANAGNHLVHPHLDGLRVGEALAGEISQGLIEQIGKLGLRLGLLPLRARLQRDEGVGQLHPHGVGGYLRGPHPAPNVLDLIGKGRQNGPLHLRVVADGFVEIGSGQSHHADGDSPFREAGNELGA